MNPRARILTSPRAAAFPFNRLDRMAMPDSPDARVEMTVSAMCALTHHAVAVGPEVAKLARTITQGRLAATEAMLGNLWLRLKDGQHHIEDPAGTEFLRHAEQSAAKLNAGQLFDGDCDDVALLAAAVLVRIGGCDVDFRVVAREGNDWEHIYVVARAWGREYVIDPQETAFPLAEREHARRRDFTVWRTS